MLTTLRRVPRLRAALIATAAAGFLAVGCADEGLQPFGDTVSPTVELAPAASPNDTTLSFVVHVKDNLGIKTIRVRLEGGVNLTRDTTFTSAVTSTSITYRIPVSSSLPPGTAVWITASAVDGAGNESLPATLLLGVGNIEAANVRITSPTSGSIAVIGKSIILSISAKSALKVRRIGYTASGVMTTADSTMFSSPFADSVAVLDTLTIPDNTPPGQLTLVPFMVDSLNQRAFGPAVNITVQTAGSTVSEPVVDFGVNSRVEMTDTIHVSASDPTGITAMGYEIRCNLLGAPNLADSVVSAGTFSTLLTTFTMQLAGLPCLDFPAEIYVKAFATNSLGTRAYARLASGLERVDTVRVVAGVTMPLPGGGRVVDGLYHQGTDHLYLSNIDRNRLEVFSLTNLTFGAAISTGSRPWGVAGWPLNRNGDMANRLLVAHSGGTSIGYIDLNGDGSGALSSSYALPNIVVNTITSEQSATVPGLLVQVRTRHEFSDRPQYLASTCQAGGGGACGDVVLVYSTTPTAGQSPPFQRRGTIRAENLTQRTSHFFFEHALGQQANRADTLEIIRIAAGGFGTDETLVPYRIPVQDPAGEEISLIVDISRIGFRDTTFARNSGNFRRAVFGEGGPVLGSRVMLYDADRGMAAGIVRDGVSYTFFPGTSPIDLGVSPAEDVGDIIANAFARVGGVAINFDGELAAIRGDSTYLVDRGLRLQGLLQTSGGNPGFDFHPRNAGNGLDVGLTACHSFAASTEPVIEVYENKHFARVATIPIREPITGPIKAARRAATGEIVLVGGTASGVIVVAMPDNFSGCP